MSEKSWGGFNSAGNDRCPKNPGADQLIGYCSCRHFDVYIVQFSFVIHSVFYKLSRKMLEIVSTVRGAVEKNK